ncbi:MAG: DegT/DnrJ/EryC1/StrS family aminotransferase, partial [Armatimonadetes bacterium]|nr:DegT/DnrJ/EryC1/StrS family aminotransferase [Armatimonadota bacterium]
PFARPGIVYDGAEYPEAKRLIEEFLCIGHSTGGLNPPNGIELMKLYADGFEKVLVDHLDEVIAMAREKAAAV